MTNQPSPDAQRARAKGTYTSEASTRAASLA